MAKTHTAMKKRRSSTRQASQRSTVRAPRSPRAAGSRRSARRSTALALPAECTLAEAEGLKLRLTSLLRESQPVTLELTDVRRIDTASMQLLAAFVRDRGASNRPVRIESASAAFVEAARLLGLSALLGASAPTH